MNNKHTKGDWKVLKSNESPHRYCTDLRVISGDKTVCSFYHLSKEYSESFNRDEVEANAKLIAAAPELLEALKNLTALQNDETPVRKYEIFLKAEEAIRKAIL